MAQSSLSKQVRFRAQNRCEYCRMPELPTLGPFHIEHIIAARHGGERTLENLALACTHCNWMEGCNLAGFDPQTGKLSRLFNPRRDPWSKHFRWNGPVIEGKTLVGRATALLLGMNDRHRVEIRRILMSRGQF